MLDDIERLRHDPRLVELLAHYAGLGAPDRSIWQKRLNTMEGIDAKELSRLHGELIAFDCIEQNPSRTTGSVAGIYRITSQGVRDLCQIRGEECPERLDTPEISKPKFPRKKKQKSDAVEILEGDSAAVFR
jgi:hypothetical protein